MRIVHHFPKLRVVLPIALLLVGAPCWAGWTLVFSFDLSGNTSVAQVLDSAQVECAHVTRGGMLPVGHTVDDEAVVPMSLLAELRDQLSNRTDTDAVEARTWIKARMGSFGETPTAGIPGNILAALHLLDPIIETSVYCGSWKGLKDECNGSCSSPCGVNGSNACCSCVCRGEAIIK